MPPLKRRSLQGSERLKLLLLIQSIERHLSLSQMNKNMYNIKQINFIKHLYNLRVFVQNVHLVARWLPSLDALLEKAAVESHPDYRVFITGEPAPTPEQHIIPRGILENAIKITNEPPTGMSASLHAALNNFSQVC